MIIPSIDIQDGRAVQLVGGRDLRIDGGDPFLWAERFAVAGEIAVVDLDAARGIGSNAPLIEELCRVARCRVGGGIRDVATAARWLDAGATRIVLGTAATPELLRQLPRERVVAAVDAVHGEVVDHGWTRRTGRSVEAQIDALRDHVSGFLVTFVEREGRMGGTATPDEVERLVERAGPCRLTVAGGVTTPDEVAMLDRLGADAQVGMALYEGTLDLGAALAAPLVSDRPDGLFPTVVVDPDGRALGLCYSSTESLAAAVRERRGIYWSRRRGLWRKGETSGETQELLRVDLDCDRDAVRFMVRPAHDVACHTGTWSCFGDAHGITAMERAIRDRMREATPGSYTDRLRSDPALLASKIVEEAAELTDARTPSEIRHEAADLLYFTTVRLHAAGLDLAEVGKELELRARRVSRRPGDAKTIRDETTETPPA
jgi:phosphoribosyl-ATP pyrophosphohydrolase/phosphoribosyl-AMP cyclohydrolase